mgnify:CR=1 FL=1
MGTAQLCKCCKKAPAARNSPVRVTGAVVPLCEACCRPRTMRRQCRYCTGWFRDASRHEKRCILGRLRLEDIRRFQRQAAILIETTGAVGRALGNPS